MFQRICNRNDLERFAIVETARAAVCRNCPTCTDETGQNERKVNIMIKKMIDELTKLERLEEIANHADADYDREPENAEYEKRFDDAYKNEYTAFMNVATMLSGWIGVDIATARAMVNGKRAELWEILKRAC